MIRTCVQCGNEFEPVREHARFCSARCRVAWNRAHPTEERIPEDLLALPAQCEALLDYLVSLMRGADDEERLAIERDDMSGAKRDRKIKMLMREFRGRRPDIAGTPPYVDLPAKLRQLFKYRDVIAHSYPDHGDRYRRLRRVQGTNEVMLVTQEKIAEEWQRGIECHSALRFIMVYLSSGAARVRAENLVHGSGQQSCSPAVRP